MESIQGLEALIKKLELEISALEIELKEIESNNEIKNIHIQKIFVGIMKMIKNNRCISSYKCTVFSSLTKQGSR